MTSKDAGLAIRYRVERVDGKPVDWCFVLQDTDPLALPALRAYASAAREAGYAALARDLETKAREMEKSRGDA